MSLQPQTPAAPRPPLAGVRIIEFEGLGPVPFAAMMLGQMGAEVVRIVRPRAGPVPFMPDASSNAIEQHRVCELMLDLKRDEHRELALVLLQRHDVLIEGYRPGVMERLGLGPERLLREQPALVYGRMTGWGQSGPLAQRAGHDINYIGLTGALHAIGRRDQAPVPPLSLVGDYGGGALFLVAGVLAALVGARASGHGRVVDAAIVDGVTLMLASVWARRAQGAWQDRRGENLLDGGAPFYDSYRTLDGRYMAVGALEAPFFDTLCRVLGLQSRWHAANQMDRAGWAAMRHDFERAFAGATQAHWQACFENVDACVTPVLALGDAPAHPHLAARASHSCQGRAVLPAAAPRFDGAAAPARQGGDAAAWLRSLQLPVQLAARVSALIATSR